MFSESRLSQVDTVRTLLYQINTECHAVNKKVEYLSTSPNKNEALLVLQEIYSQLTYINRQLEAPQQERDDNYAFINSFWGSD